MENCMYCGKKQPMFIDNDTIGAVFICRNSGSDNVFIAPVNILRLSKRRGCVEFGYTGASEIFKPFSVDCSFCITIDDDYCRQVYLDCPAEGEAWLVKPLKDGWGWTHVDPDIAFYS